jgi:uncharacterized cupredoxin-like copper-binding protein
MRPSRLPLLPAVALLIAACSSGTGSTASPSLAPSLEPSASAEATRIDVKLTDALKMEPATMTVPAGVPVTFVVSNTGAIEHEFFLGDEAAQAEHEQEMQQGGMAHDEEMGIGLEPGETKELTVTLPEAGTIIAGCHVAGHYAGGMKATVEIGS